LLNDTVFVECARALGRRVVAETPGAHTGERLRHAFRLCVGRPPTAAEQATLQRLFDGLLGSCRANPEGAARLAGAAPAPGTDGAEAGAWVALARALLNLDEFVTRE
jgi:hypothetical protein